MKTRFDWRSAYFNVVSLVCIVVFLFAAIACGHGLLRIAVPSLAMDQYSWERTRSFEAFKRSTPRDVRPVERGEVRPETTEVASTSEEDQESEAELRREWEEAKTLMLEGERRRGLWSVIQSAVTILIVVPVFWWHRRQVKLLRDSVLINDKQES